MTEARFGRSILKCRKEAAARLVAKTMPQNTQKITHVGPRDSLLFGYFLRSDSVRASWHGQGDVGLEGDENVSRLPYYRRRFGDQPKPTRQSGEELDENYSDDSFVLQQFILHQA